MSAQGSVSRRCACRDENGKQLGKKCPKLKSRRHGSWGYILDVPAKPPAKRTQMRRRGFATRDEAQEALDKVRARLGYGQEVNDKETTGEWLESWLAGKKKLRETTRRCYRSHLDLYLKPHIGHVPLEGLRVAHIAAMFDEIERGNDERERKVGPASMQRIRATLRSALGAAVKQQRILSNPASHVELPSGKRPRAVVWSPERVAEWKRTGKLPSPVMVWTPEQLGKFLDHAADDRLTALYHLVAFRGLRRGEAVGLPWSDVDLDSGLLTVSQQIVQLGWATQVGAPKSDHGARTIPLDAGTVAVLKAHKARQNAERLSSGSGWNDAGLVFTREDGQPLHPAYVTSHFETLVSGAKLPPIRLHDLRHGAASLTYAATRDIKAVQELLGHSASAITLDTYTSVFDEVAREAAEAAARLVPRARTTP